MSRPLLARDGGEPVRSRPFPTVNTPEGRRLGEEEATAAADVVRSGQLNSTVGPQTRLWEQEFAAYYGVGNAVASSSGTSALHLAVAAVNPAPGDEIITTGLSDAGTVLPILSQNAVPVFADVDPRTGILDVDATRALITERTRAIIVVHLFGIPAPVEDFRQLADEHGLILIEDCAQAYLTESAGGALAGTVGHLGCFSLQQSKHITAGDGGVTISNDDVLARRARMFADKAWPRDTDERTHLFLGLNYRMTEMQAAIARVQLGKLADVVNDRRKLAADLTDAVAGLPGLSAAPAAGNAYWQFPIYFDPELAGGDAFAYAAALGPEGIPGGPGYIQRPLYLTPLFTDAQTYGDSGFPLAERRSGQEFAPGLCPVTEGLIGGRLLVVPWNENYTVDDVSDLAAGLTKVSQALRP